MAARWTPAEDETLLALMDEHGACWDGWARALPTRTRGAIYTRWRELVRRADERRPWTEQQRRAMLFHATAMVRDAGHGIDECMDEIARLQRAHCKHR